MQAVQLDNPLQFLINRTSHSMKRMYCSESTQYYTHESRPTPASLVLTPPIPLGSSCDVLGSARLCISSLVTRRAADPALRAYTILIFIHMPIVVTILMLRDSSTEEAFL